MAGHLTDLRDRIISNLGELFCGKHRAVYLHVLVCTHAGIVNNSAALPQKLSPPPDKLPPEESECARLRSKNLLAVPF